jgi:hypothetical protein
MGAERDDGERDEVARLLEASREHQLRVRDDLLATHRVLALAVEHPGEDRSVGFLGEPAEHPLDRVAERRARLVGRRLLRGVCLEVRQAPHQALVPAQQVLPRHLVQPKHEPQRTHAHRVRELAEQIGPAAPLETVDQLVRELRDHPLRPLLDVARAERRLDDPADPLLIRPFRAEHVHAHRPIQRGGLGRRREQLRREVDVPDVVVPGDEPELHGRHPAHRLIVSETRVDRVRVALELLERNGVADAHRSTEARAEYSETGSEIPLSSTGPIDSNVRSLSWPAASTTASDTRISRGRA